MISEKIDYCSGSPELNVASCCKIHDSDYESIGKLKADWNFLQCMLNKATNYKKLHHRIATRIVAGVYYTAVSIFGWLPYFKAQNILHDYFDTLEGSKRIDNDLNHYSYKHNGAR